MMIRSTKTKESIKTALAMTIAYAIALAMDWEKAYWAGFAVAFISLSTIEESLNKGLMRMLGTLVAGVAALTLIALFPQQRWWFMAMLSVYIGFCTYMMMGKKYPYFYQVAAFVCVIICFDGGVNSLNAFATTISRILETGMGIAVYALVAIFLWPQNASDDLNNATGKISNASSKHAVGVFSLDPRRLTAVLEVVFSLWLSFLIWVYVNPPGHASFVIIVTALSLALVRFPSIQVSKMFVPAIFSCIVSGGLYLFVMPHLSGFGQLGLMIFAATFGIAYVFSEPKQAFYRAFGLAFFAILTSISNQQAYSFAGYANSSIMIILGISTLLITNNLPFRQQLCKERF